MYAALWLLPLGQSIETIATSQSFAAAAQGFAYPHMDSKQRIFFQLALLAWNRQLCMQRKQIRS